MGKETAIPRKLVCCACRDKKIKCEQDPGRASCRHCLAKGIPCSGPQHTDRWLEKQQKKMMPVGSSRRTVQRSDIPDVSPGQKQIAPGVAPTPNLADVSLTGTARSTNVPASAQAPLNYGYNQNNAPNALAYPRSVANALGDHMRRTGDPLPVINNAGIHMPSWLYNQASMDPTLVANQNVPRGASSPWSHGTIQSAYANQNANLQSFPYSPMDVPAYYPNQNIQMNKSISDQKEFEELLRSLTLENNL